MRPLSRRSLTLGLAALGTAVLAKPHVARAAIRVVRLAHNNMNEESHYGQGAAAFAQAVAADPALSTAFRFEVHGKAQLGDELSTLKSCAAGTLDAALISNSVIGNVVPEAGVLDAPFLFSDVAHARAALDGAIGEEYAALVAAKNVQVLAWAENGLRHITANQPIRNPADLHGLKIRIPQSDVMVNGFKALGADPTALNFNLVPEALRSGEIKAQENPIVVIETAKLYELQKFLSLTGHIYDPAAFICSGDFAEDLSAPQLDAMKRCARKAADVTRAISAAAQIEGIGRLRAAGMTVVDDVDVAAFRTASRPYLESLSATYGADRMKRLLGAQA